MCQLKLPKVFLLKALKKWLLECIVIQTIMSRYVKPFGQENQSMEGVFDGRGLKFFLMTFLTSVLFFNSHILYVQLL